LHDFSKIRWTLQGEIKKHNALVTGAHRGMGFAFYQQVARKGLKGLSALLTSIDCNKGDAAALKLRNENLYVVFLQGRVKDRENKIYCKKFLNQNVIRSTF